MSILSQVEKCNGSLFLNNKTQSVRLKKKVKFEENPERLIAFNLLSNDKHSIFLMELDVEDEFIKALDTLPIEVKESIAPKDINVNEGQSEWQKHFSGRRNVSVFLNNTTQSVRIPSSFAFENYEENKTVEVILYQLESGRKVLEIYR